MTPGISQQLTKAGTARAVKSTASSLLPVLLLAPAGASKVPAVGTGACHDGDEASQVLIVPPSKQKVPEHDRA